MILRNRWMMAGWIWLALAYLFLLIPLMVLVVFSFQKNRFPGFPLQGWTVAWYEDLLTDSSLIEAFKNSLLVSPAAATVATAIGFLSAYAFRRFSFPGKSIFLTVTTLPILIPPLILGIAFLGQLARLHISGTLFAVFLTHVVLITGPALAIIQLRLSQMPNSLEEAAWNLGATEWQGLTRAVLPFVIPGIAGAWLLAFTFSFDEFIIAWFVSGFETTLPVAVYSVLVARIDPTLSAVGTIVFLISCGALVAVEFLLMRLLTGRDEHHG